MDPRLRDAAYLYALSQIKGLRPTEILHVTEVFPDPEELMSAGKSEIAEKLQRRKLPNLAKELSRSWEDAGLDIRNHIKNGIHPIPITDQRYPSLLRLIDDRPPLLYVRGDVSPLSVTDAVAVVGTRDPTDNGLKVARRIATSLARSGYVVVSGLAKGIDTVAHAAALEAGGKTIAVLGTPLDEIYPAENKGLAERIIDQSGALVGEIPLGKPTSKAAFVRRDRIQSGLSLAVFAVQTDLAGGTMHTVAYAEKQDRLVFCPAPSAEELNAKQNAGIRHLVRSGRAREFSEPSRILLETLRQHKEALLRNPRFAKRAQRLRPAEFVQEKIAKWT